MSPSVLLETGISLDALLARLENVRGVALPIFATCPGGAPAHDLILMPVGGRAESPYRAQCRGGCAPERLWATIVGREEATHEPAPEAPAEASSAKEAPVPAVLAPTLSLDDVAGELGIHRRTVRARIREGSLSARLLGGRWRIARADLDAFLGALPRSWGTPDEGGSHGVPG